MYIWKLHKQLYFQITFDTTSTSPLLVQFLFISDCWNRIQIWKELSHVHLETYLVFTHETSHVHLEAA